MYHLVGFHLPFLDLFFTVLLVHDLEVFLRLTVEKLITSGALGIDELLVEQMAVLATAKAMPGLKVAYVVFSLARHTHPYEWSSGRR